MTDHGLGGDAAYQMRVELARRKGERAGRAMEVGWAAAGFGFRREVHGAEAARRCRAADPDGDLAVTVAAVTTGVMDCYGHAYNHDVVADAIRRSLAGP